MPDLSARLAHLRNRIVRDLFVKRWHEVWFYPPRGEVKGWQGTDPVIIVGLNPSAGHFPSAADLFLYAQLRKRGLQNAHLTDVVKVRATRDEAPRLFEDAFIVNLSREYLLEEVAILNPRLVVAFGEKAHDVLRRWLPNTMESLLVRIPHYSYAYRYRRRMAFVRAIAYVSSKLLSDES